MKKMFLLLIFLVACAQPQVVEQMPPPPVQEPVQEPVVEVQPVVSAPSTVAVEIKDFKFQPATVNIKVGDTVVWTQNDNTQHTVTIVSGPESFDSGLLSKSQTFSHTFTKSGTYSYKCTPHPGMKGGIVVE